MEAAFVAYADGRCVVPPPGELTFQDPPGDVHIKYGYISGDDHFVVKIASGFYDNPALGLSSCDGLMLVFAQRTGALEAILLDEGNLTDIRTAAAGAVCARHLAPAVTRVGVFGSGIQARRQLELLRKETPCRDVMAWGRDKERLATYAAEMGEIGYTVETTTDPDAVTASCNLIVTCTPSTTPLVRAAALRAGTHVTAVGSDTPTKQELESSVIERADVIVADSLSQCRDRGEIHHASDPGSVVQLGDVVAGRATGRTSDDQITVADLTGVAVQDVAIATAVLNALG
ncbi:MAG: ornithine cyclodeaminase family protein [Planctomycetes bacterium]|nr:ornithine cyclodeaminase family protein [Planctomycetota bacterium]